ncbi:hypothetical protein MNBD_GAMMA04-1640 [hydrothermal vent metagenome]|uniref:Ice-binding protein C-terminal domain-containing protein n=1 Tax=hydrothermal vent metagenome TaxID=652676 RepID=A0A3B0WWT1_9ZZZZ
MKLSHLILTGVCTIAINMPAKAAVVWNLNDFFFDSQAVQGYFVWNEDNNSISDWNIATGAFSDSPDYYNPSGSSSTLNTASNQTLLFNDGSSNWQFRIGVEDLDLLDISGTIVYLKSNLSVGSTGFLECRNCGPFRYGDTGGYLTSAVSPVPEPSAITLMLGGLGLVGFMAARRRKALR